MDYLTAAEKAKVEAARIPVDSWKPATMWIVSLSNESLMPTELELRILRNFTEFAVKRFYNERYVQKLLVEQPMAKDAGSNTLTLMKGWRNAGDTLLALSQGWHYRRWSWEVGPPFIPAKYGVDEPYKALTLVQCLDRVERWSAERRNTEWEAWKAQHPELYREERAS